MRSSPAALEISHRSNWEAPTWSRQLVSHDHPDDIMFRWSWSWSCIVIWFHIPCQICCFWRIFTLSRVFGPFLNFLFVLISESFPTFFFIRYFKIHPERFIHFPICLHFNWGLPLEFRTSSQVLVVGFLLFLFKPWKSTFGPSSTTVTSQ